MTEDASRPSQDPGLRHLIKWTAIALVAAVVFALIAVAITIQLFQ